MLMFVLLSLFLQIVVVATIHHANKRRMMVEMVSTLAFMKPAFNYWRVLTNAKIEGHEVVPPVHEMILFLTVEVFAECIPVTVLQVIKILDSEELDIVVLLALLTSAAVVADAIAYVTYVRDSNEEIRRTGKLFYGFMPLSGIRLMIVMIAMHVLSFCQLVGKSIAIALLAQIGGKSLAILVLSCEIGAYLLYKIVRRDFFSWLPVPNTAYVASARAVRTKRGAKRRVLLLR